MPRRLMGVWFTGEAVGVITCSGRRTVAVRSQIPKDAEFVHGYFDHDRNAFVAVFEHSSFEAIQDGSLIPASDASVIAEEIELETQVE